MQENIKRGLSGVVYVSVIWFGTSYSETTYILLFSFLGITSIYEMWMLRKGKSKLLALSYIIIPFFLIQLFGMTDSNYPESKFDASIVLFMLLLTWTFDTFAYLFGVKFGEHKIIPSISPKKSWEGFFAGFIFVIIASYLSISSIKLFNSINNALIITISLPFTATIGDLIVSYYKRKAGVKDSGNLIPGHGGILDRMDAFIISIPIIYIINIL